MHVIRLRKPWSKTVDGRPEVHRVDVPDVAHESIESEGFPGQKEGDVGQRVAGPSPCRAEYRRRFNRPSGLVRQRVFLRISAWQGQLESLQLNGVEIPVCPGDESIEANVESLLEGHNELIVNLLGDPQTPPILTGEVVLAIEE